MIHLDTERKVHPPTSLYHAVLPLSMKKHRLFGKIPVSDAVAEKTCEKITKTSCKNMKSLV